MASLGHLFCVLVSFLCPVSCNGLPKAQEEHKTLFVFGDSLFDPGNNQYLNASVEGGAPPWPYGETYFGHSTGRLSDGRLVPDFIGNNHISHSNAPIAGIETLCLWHACGFQRILLVGLFAWNF